jgi:hypothetical protein
MIDQTSLISQVDTCWRSVVAILIPVPIHSNLSDYRCNPFNAGILAWWGCPSQEKAWEHSTSPLDNVRGPFYTLDFIDFCDINCGAGLLTQQKHLVPVQRSAHLYKTFSCHLTQLLQSLINPFCSCSDVQQQPASMAPNGLWR